MEHHSAEVSALVYCEHRRPEGSGGGGDGGDGGDGSGGVGSAAQAIRQRRHLLTAAVDGKIWVQDEMPHNKGEKLAKVFFRE